MKALLIKIQGKLLKDLQEVTTRNIFRKSTSSHILNKCSKKVWLFGNLFEKFIDEI